MQSLFISHASADRALADELVDLLRLGSGVPADRVFYSSGAGTAVPAGQRFNEYIRSQVQDAALVIALITESFLASPFCIAEVGAAWALEDNLFPLAIRKIDRVQLDGVLQGAQIRYLDDAGALAELHDRVCSALNLSGSVEPWERYKDRFIAKVESLMPSGQPNTLSAQLKSTDSVSRASLTAKSGGLSLFTFDDPGIATFPELVSDSRAVHILSRTSVNLLGHYEGVFRELMDAGCEVRLLMVDPVSPAAKHLYGDSEDVYQRNFESAAAHLTRLAPYRQRGLLQVRKCRDAPAFSLVVAEKEPRANSAMNIQVNMLYACVGRDRPVLRLSGDDRWFNHFTREFTEIWARSRDWDDD